METYRTTVMFIFYTALSGGISFGIIYLLMLLGDFRERLKKSLLDIEKLKSDSHKSKETTHRVLNDIEKIKQSIKKISEDNYFNYWDK